MMQNNALTREALRIAVKWVGRKSNYLLLSMRNLMLYVGAEAAA